jgi:hypothetical protein
VAKYVDSTVAIFGTVDEAGDTRIRLDPETRGLVTVPWEHYLIHKGLMYAALYTTLDVADGDYTDLVIRTSPIHTLHTFKARWWAEGTALLEVWAGFEFDDETGTEFEPFNMLFGAPSELQARFWVDPDVTGGVAAFSQIMPGGTISPFGAGQFDSRTGSFHEIAYEWVLPADFEAMVRITNLSGGASGISGQLNSYENGHILE